MDFYVKTTTLWNGDWWCYGYEMGKLIKSRIKDEFSEEAATGSPGEWWQGVFKPPLLAAADCWTYRVHLGLHPARNGVRLVV